MASEAGVDESFAIAQNIKFSVMELEQGKAQKYEVKEGRLVWLQLARGELLINDELIRSGDAMSFDSRQNLKIEAKQDAEVLLFDMAK
ncbi:hypothetical protein PQO03_19650 [Lentisphaera profundi]|uniref:Quercetin 2,3-dioxygenase C-terminal cupin domain-containing protein n=1 Tax=Lentisphaera profundi TaxID=1658616 RepID=A0ABY7VYV7_9BACT|nr:hypothetical protein [Lentisphaera profundi]WDE99468.1 hypothetical protein PQO03_19650 [Lentisphaera profundi]